MQGEDCAPLAVRINCFVSGRKLFCALIGRLTEQEWNFGGLTNFPHARFWDGGGLWSRYGGHRLADGGGGSRSEPRRGLGPIAFATGVPRNGLAGSKEGASRRFFAARLKSGLLQGTGAEARTGLILDGTTEVVPLHLPLPDLEVRDKGTGAEARTGLRLIRHD